MRIAVAALLALALCHGAAAPAAAKEHNAGCPAISGLIERLRGSLVLASFHRARGSSMAAYEAMRTAADSVAADGAAAGCGVVPAVMKRALARAGEARSALDASLELDLGFAAAISAALTGRMPPRETAAKLIEVEEAAEFGEGCPDIFRIRRRLDTAAERDGLDAQVAAVVAELRAGHRCGRVLGLLERPPKEGIAHAVDSLRLDEPVDASQAKSPLFRCPELPIVFERLTAAISVGAPLFNRGDHAACRAEYERVARRLRDQSIPVGRCPLVRSELTSALDEAGAARNAGEAAWALRRAFDRITGAARSVAPQPSSAPSSSAAPDRRAPVRFSAHDVDFRPSRHHLCWENLGTALDLPERVALSYTSVHSGPDRARPGRSAAEPVGDRLARRKTVR